MNYYLFYIFASSLLLDPFSCLHFFHSGYLFSFLIFYVSVIHPLSFSSIFCNFLLFAFYKPLVATLRLLKGEKIIENNKYAERPFCVETTVLK